MIEKGIAVFFAGSLMALVVYHLSLFILYRRAKEYLYLALLCLGILLRSLTLNGNGIPLAEIVPLPFEYFKKIEYICVYGLMAILPLYFYNVFPHEFPKKMLKAFVAIGITFCFLPVVTIYSIYAQVLNFCHVVYVVELIVIGVVIHRARKNDREEAGLTLIALAFASPAVIIEIIANSGFMHLSVHFLVELALLIFLGFQSFILAKRNSKAFYLAQLKKADLQKAVELKTTELSESNELKNMLLSIMSHDVKSPLNSIKGVLSLINSDFIQKDEMKPVTLQLEEQVHNTSILVDNILHWCASQSRAITIRKTKINLRPLVDECLSLFTFQARNKKIELINNVGGGMFLFADENIIKLVLRNLISNALKFSNPNGFVKISLVPENSYLKLTIEDNGIGIPKEKIPTLFDIDKNVSRIGTKQEVGTGIGLSLCKKFLQAMGSEITVESGPSLGSRFHIHVANNHPDAKFNSVMFVESKVA